MLQVPTEGLCSIDSDPPLAGVCPQLGRLVSVLSWADTQKKECRPSFSTICATLAKIQAEAFSPNCSMYCPELVRKAMTSDSRVKNHVLSISEECIIFVLQLWALKKKSY